MTNHTTDTKEINKYGVEIWLLEALKAYDSIMTDEVRRRDTIRTMKSKRKLQQAIKKLISEEVVKELRAIPNFEVLDEPENAVTYILNRIKELTPTSAEELSKPLSPITKKKGQTNG